MFELLLMRHAKSDWHSHTADIDRPLNSRGRHDAVRMGAYLDRNALVPDSMVISPSQRTRETASLLRQNLDVAEDRVHVDNDLYLAGTETILEAIELYARDAQRLLLLAHNPGMDLVVSYLSSSPPALSDSGKLMTTCAVACFEVPSLDAIRRPGQAELKYLLRPKQIIADC
jgi:phosphohistidine phosphatase